MKGGGRQYSAVNNGVFAFVLCFLVFCVHGHDEFAKDVRQISASFCFLGSGGEVRVRGGAGSLG